MSTEASPPRSESASALAPGTRLHEFELQRILGVGGFGIVYQAFDHALEREVAIKEYMPASLAGRTETMRVSLRSASDEESFRLGRESFVKEAKLLARFDHPSLLKVYRYWEDNGTAYMAMPILRGRTLKQVRQARQEPVDEPWLRGILMPLLGAIETLHRESVYHRDIAPDNIQIEPDGHPVLMDFGAARRVLTDKTQSLTAILKPAYAPIEQYGEAGAVKQGPWTDLYALGATLHYVLLGRPPAPATARTVDDEEVLLTQAQLPQCSQGFLLAIQWMLRPRPSDRPQSVAQLREVLEGRAAIPPHVGIGEMRTQVYRPEGAAPVVGALDVDVTGLPRASQPSEDLPTQLAAAPAPAEATIRVVTPPAPASAPSAGAAAAVERLAEPTAAPLAPAARSPSPWVWVLLGLGAVGAAAAVFWPRTEPAPVPSTQAAPVAAPVSVAPAPSASAVLPAAAGAGALPESAVTTVVVPPAGPPAAAGPANATGASPALDRAAAPRPAPATPSSGTSSVASPGTSSSTSGAPATAKPTRVAEPKPAPVAAPAPAGPGPSCGARSDGVRYLVCMERECAAPAFANHPACSQIRQ